MLSRFVIGACLSAQALAGSDEVSMALKKQLVQQLVTVIPTCEELCKKTNGYFPADSGLADPACRNCIPAGGDATAGSANAKNCMEKYCDELAQARGAGMCPNDGFMECVSANTAVPALLQQISFVQQAISKYTSALSGKQFKAQVAAKGSISVKRSLVEQLATAIPTCEELCKKTNGYFPADSGLADPACRNCIPAGGSAVGGSVNAKTCMDKNCDELAMARGAGMCPNDGFMECVSANTAVPALIQDLSFVQQKIAKYVKALKGERKLLRTQRTPDPCKSITCPALKCPAPFVIAEEAGHCCSYCVPSDPSLIKDTKDYSQQATEAYATYKTAKYR